MAMSFGGDTDTGSASIWTLGCGLALTLLALTVTGMGNWLVESHIVRAAADLGALAGAEEANRGESVACQRAQSIVEENGAGVAECHLEGLELVVTAERNVANVGETIRVTARAGPIRVYASQGSSLDG